MRRSFILGPNVLSNPAYLSADCAHMRVYDAKIKFTSHMTYENASFSICNFDVGMSVYLSFYVTK